MFGTIVVGFAKASAKKVRCWLSTLRLMISRDRSIASDVNCITRDMAAYTNKTIVNLLSGERMNIQMNIAKAERSNRKETYLDARDFKNCRMRPFCGGLGWLASGIGLGWLIRTWTYDP